MECKTYTVAQLIEKLQTMPQDALVLCTGVSKGYRAVDFIELFDNKDIRTSLLKQANGDEIINQHEGEFVYLDCMYNLI